MFVFHGYRRITLTKDSLTSDPNLTGFRSAPGGSELDLHDITILSVTPVRN
jgi:hypothetical protein